MMKQHLTNLFRTFFPYQHTTTIEDVYPCLIGQADRNKDRMDKIKAEMGAKYILHPSHTMKRKLKKARPV